MTMVTLYAWVVPAYFDDSPVDHTWVTDYDNRVSTYTSIAAVKAAGDHCWYCWGSFHAKGGTPAVPDGYIGSQAGDLGLASCLVTPNADSSAVYSARGTIFTYGIDGVCHQLANQVLYASGQGGGAPLVVSKARGYWASSAIYGTYGLQHLAWSSKIAACSGTSHATPGTVGMTVMAASTHQDEFENHAASVLAPSRASTLAQLLQTRAQFHTASALQAHTMAKPSAAELNARNQGFFDAAAQMLTRDEFIAVFGIEPGRKIDLVLANPTP